MSKPKELPMPKGTQKFFITARDGNRYEVLYNTYAICQMEEYLGESFILTAYKLLKKDEAGMPVNLSMKVMTRILQAGLEGARIEQVIDGVDGARQEPFTFPEVCMMTAVKGGIISMLPDFMGAFNDSFSELEQEMGEKKSAKKADEANPTS